MTITQFTEHGQLQVMRKKSYSLPQLYEEFARKPLSPTIPEAIVVGVLAGLYHKTRQQISTIEAAISSKQPPPQETPQYPTCRTIDDLFLAIFKRHDNDLSQADYMRLICLALRRSLYEVEVSTIALKRTQEKNQLPLF